MRGWVRGCVRSCVRVVVRARGEHGAVPQVGLLLMGLLATVGCGGSEGAAEPADMHPVLDLSEVPACYTLLSTKGAVGCRSPAPGGTRKPSTCTHRAAACRAWGRSLHVGHGAAQPLLQIVAAP